MLQRATAAFIAETSDYKCVWASLSRVPTRQVFLATQAFTIFIFGRGIYPGGTHTPTYMAGALRALVREAEATTTPLNTCIVRASCYCEWSTGKLAHCCSIEYAAMRSTL